MLIGKIIFLLIGYLSADKLKQKHEARKLRRRQRELQNAPPDYQSTTISQPPTQSQIQYNSPATLQPIHGERYYEAQKIPPEPSSRTTIQPRIHYLDESDLALATTDGEIVYEAQEIPPAPVSGLSYRPRILSGSGDLGHLRGSDDGMFYEGDQHYYTEQKIPG